jgi:hypothetical protein
MASDKLYEIQSIIDESKETLSSDLYNKLSIACKKSFDSEKQPSKIFVKVKIMFFTNMNIQGSYSIVPKFRFDVIPVSPYQLSILLRRNEEQKFTMYRNHKCNVEQTQHFLSDKEYCDNCDEETSKNITIYTGEYIVYTYRVGNFQNWIGYGAENKRVSFVEDTIPEPNPADM